MLKGDAEQDPKSRIEEGSKPVERTSEGEAWL